MLVVIYIARGGIEGSINWFWQAAGIDKSPKWWAIYFIPLPVRSTRGSPDKPYTDHDSTADNGIYFPGVDNVNITARNTNMHYHQFVSYNHIKRTQRKNYSTAGKNDPLQYHKRTYLKLLLLTDKTFVSVWWIQLANKCHNYYETDKLFWKWPFLESCYDHEYAWSHSNVYVAYRRKLFLAI